MEMVYLFSSTSRELYKRNVLDACCYPEGHVLRFRYSEHNIQPSVKSSPNLLLQENALVIFADPPTEASGTTSSRDSDTAAPPEFHFYPIREAQIVRVRWIAGMLFVDAKLGKFVNYESGTHSEAAWNDSVKQLVDHPRPGLGGAKTFFIYWAPSSGIAYSTLENQPYGAWRSVIDRINESSLRESITYQISGFYYVEGPRSRLKDWLTNRRAAVAGAVRSPDHFRSRLAKFLTPEFEATGRVINPSYAAGNCIYRFKAGRSVTLRVLFYRKTEKRFDDAVLRLIWDRQVFSSASKDELRIQSRYDQEEILLTCSRLSERTLSTLRIVQTQISDDKAWASQPSFVVQVAPPAGYVFLVCVVFGLGLLLLNTSTADLNAYLGPYLPALTSYVSPWILFWAVRFVKPLGTLFWIGATWMFLRKFPLK
jgi:hypothetical protein